VFCPRSLFCRRLRPGRLVLTCGRYSHILFAAKRGRSVPQVESPTLARRHRWRKPAAYTHTRSSLNLRGKSPTITTGSNSGVTVRPLVNGGFPYPPFSNARYPELGCSQYAALPVQQHFSGSGGFGWRWIRWRWIPVVVGLTRHASGPWPHPGQGFQSAAEGWHPGKCGQFPIRQNGWRMVSQPYPLGRGSPYPVARTYDGYYPNYRGLVPWQTAPNVRQLFQTDVSVCQAGKGLTRSCGVR